MKSTTLDAAKTSKWTLIAVVGLPLLIALWPKVGTSSESESDQVLKKRQEMVVIARQLGVTCAYCHDVNNFRSNRLKTFKVAKEHLRVTQLLNKKGFKGAPKVDCYLCHRGQARPAYKEPLEEK